MTRLTALLILISASLASNAAETGRYELVQGEYLINDYVNGSQMYARTTFKIDTVTGEVWAAEANYMPTGNGSKLRIYWLPTENFRPLTTPQDLLNEFQRWAQQPAPSSPTLP
ncbi:hypothetical protein [Endothiovibrio diazotrophicus]